MTVKKKVKSHPDVIDCIKDGKIIFLGGGGNCPRRDFSGKGGNFLGGIFLCDFFPGGIFLDTHFKSTVNLLKTFSILTSYC